MRRPSQAMFSHLVIQVFLHLNNLCLLYTMFTYHKTLLFALQVFLYFNFVYHCEDFLSISLIADLLENNLRNSRPFSFHRNSVELVFAEFAHPLYLKQSDALRFWYGEDLSKIGYTDNQGEVCFHVFALFV